MISDPDQDLRSREERGLICPFPESRRKLLSNPVVIPHAFCVSVTTGARVLARSGLNPTSTGMYEDGCRELIATD